MEHLPHHEHDSPWDFRIPKPVGPLSFSLISLRADDAISISKSQNLLPSNQDRIRGAIWGELFQAVGQDMQPSSRELPERTPIHNSLDLHISLFTKRKNGILTHKVSKEGSTNPWIFPKKRLSTHYQCETEPYSE